MCLAVFLKETPESGEWVVADNPAAACFVALMRSEDSGLEIQPLDDEFSLGRLATIGASKVLALSYSMPVLKLLRRHGIEAFKAVNPTPEDNLACFFSGELRPYDFYKDRMSGGCSTTVKSSCGG
jgi:hypothetical protein